MDTNKLNSFNKLGLAIAGILFVCFVIWTVGFFLGFTVGKKLTVYQVKDSILTTSVYPLGRGQYVIGLVEPWPWEPLRVQFLTSFKMAVFDKRGEPTMVDWMNQRPPQQTKPPKGGGENETKKKNEAKR